MRILGKQVINLLDLRIQNLNLNRQVKEKTAEVNEIFERQSLIMDAAIDAIICLDASGAITFWNPQAEKIFKWEEKEILGRLLADTIIPKQYREQHKKGLAHYLKTGEGVFIE